MIALDRLGLSAMEHLICYGLLYIGFTISSIALEAEYSVTRASWPYYSYLRHSFRRSSKQQPGQVASSLARPIFKTKVRYCTIWSGS